VIHLISATLRYASRKYWDKLAGDLRRIYTAATIEAAWAAFEELEEKWGKPYPAIRKDVARSLGGIYPVPGLGRGDPPGGCSPPMPSNHSHARYRRAVTARGHFPTEQAALKCLYLVTRGLDPKGTGQAHDGP